MKRVARIISLALCALISSTVFSVPFTTTVSAQPEVEWVARWSGQVGADDWGHKVVVGPSGNVYVTGVGTVTAFAGEDYITICYDSSGNELWVARYDHPEISFQDWAFDMVIDSSENIYITGSSGGYANWDIATVAYDSSGNELWVATFDSSPIVDDRGTDMSIDSLGNIYVTGWSENLQTGVSDIVTLAYDSNGNELWVATFDGPAGLRDAARDIAVDPFGNVYVTGVTNTIEGDEPGEGESDYVTIAYDSSGRELWAATYDGPGGEEGTLPADEARAMATDSSGNVYVTGISTGIGTGVDATTIAYDSNGNELWVARYNGPASGGDAALDIVADAFGNIYVTGGSTGIGWDGILTIAYDSNGNELWAATYNDPRNIEDYGIALATDSFGNIFVTGRSYGGGWENDIVTIAYDSNGNELWALTYDGGIGDTDIPSDIAVNRFGDVYVTGTSMYNDTGHDIITIKYASGLAPGPGLDIDPDTLNLKSKGRWITAYIELYDGRDVRDIDISTIFLNETIPAKRWPTATGDHDEDGIPDLMVKFNRSRVQEYIEGLNLSPGGAGIFGYYITLTVTGSFNDGTTFECSDTIRVLVVERMGVEPSPFSVAEYDGSMKGGLLAYQPLMSFPLSSHSSEDQVMVVSDTYCCELPNRKTKHDVFMTRE